MSTFHPLPANSTNPLVSAKNNPSSSRLDELVDSIQLGTFYNTDLFFSLSKINFYNGGKKYHEDTTVLFPAPDHESGVRATGQLYLGLTAASLTVSGGTRHLPGDTYLVYPNGFFEDESPTVRMPAIVGVLEVDVEGAVTKWTLMNPGKGFNNLSPTVVPNYKSPRANAFAATVTLNPNLFTIVDVEFVNYGSGYLKSPYTRYLTFENAGDGAGCVCTVNSKTNTIVYRKQDLETIELDPGETTSKPLPIYDFPNNTPKGSLKNYTVVYNSPVLTHNDYQ